MTVVLHNDQNEKFNSVASNFTIFFAVVVSGLKNCKLPKYMQYFVPFYYNTIKLIAIPIV